MPEKDGAEEKSTKSVVNKKQKLGEEGYDIARDMGKVRPSKKKKDATTMPPSKEMKKTQKVNKGPSALDIVKKKYKGQIMNVGKKKVKEELDLTQVAEAFGGYIIEATSGRKPKGYLTKRISLTGEIPPEERTVQKNVDDLANKKIKDAEQVYRDEDPNSPTYGQVLYKTGDEDKGVTAQRDAATKKTAAYQQAKAKGKQGVANPTKFTDDTRTQAQFDADEAERARKRSTGKGDGRRAGRTPEERKTGQVTYQTFVNKPEVTGGQDRTTDTAFQPFRPKPETKPETKKRVRRVKPKKDKVITQQEPQKTKTEPQTQTQMGDGEPPKPPKVGTSTGASGDTPKAFSSIKKFAKGNPQIAAAGALAGYDLGKGILSKIMNLRGPGLRGGTVGRRSAGSFTAT